MTNKKEYMIILFLHLPPLVLTQSRVRTLAKQTAISLNIVINFRRVR